MLAAFSNGDRSSLEEGSGELLLHRGRLFEPKLHLHARGGGTSCYITRDADAKETERLQRL